MHVLHVYTSVFCTMYYIYIYAFWEQRRSTFTLYTFTYLPIKSLLPAPAFLATNLQQIFLWEACSNLPPETTPRLSRWQNQPFPGTFSDSWRSKMENSLYPGHVSTPIGRTTAEFPPTCSRFVIRTSNASSHLDGSVDHLKCEGCQLI